MTGPTYRAVATITPVLVHLSKAEQAAVAGKPFTALARIRAAIRALEGKP